MCCRGDKIKAKLTRISVLNIITSAPSLGISGFGDQIKCCIFWMEFLSEKDTVCSSKRPNPERA